MMGARGERSPPVRDRSARRIPLTAAAPVAMLPAAANVISGDSLSVIACQNKPTGFAPAGPSFFTFL
jgi:hypothetical protein